MQTGSNISLYQMWKIEMIYILVEEQEIYGHEDQSVQLQLLRNDWLFFLMTRFLTNPRIFKTILNNALVD